MSILFSAGDIFEIAIEIERNGAGFYRKAASLTGDAQVRAELLELAAMEDTHEATFIQMKRDLVGDDKVAEWYDAEDEVVRYLQAFAAGQVFDMTKDPTTWLSPETPLKEVIAFALERERDSVLFFVGVKDLVPQSMGSTKIETIIKQEMAHIALLSRRLMEVSQQV